MVTLMHRAELGMKVNTKTLSRIHKTHVNIGGWGFLCSPGNLVPMEHLGFNSAVPSVASEPTAWEPGRGWVLTRQEGATWKLSLLWASVTLRRPDDWHSSASHLCTASCPWDMSTKGPLFLGKGHSHVPEMLFRKNIWDKPQHTVPSSAARAVGRKLVPVHGCSPKLSQSLGLLRLVLRKQSSVLTGNVVPTSKS